MAIWLDGVEYTGEEKDLQIAAPSNPGVSQRAAQLDDGDVH